VFRDNSVDAEVLSKLTVEDLKDIGVTRVGDRRNLLEAIAALRARHPGGGHRLDFDGQWHGNDAAAGLAPVRHRMARRPRNEDRMKICY
jgi:hypothetical protein